MWLDESEQNSVCGSDSVSWGWCLCCREDSQSLSVLVPLCGRTHGLHETAAGTALSVFVSVSLSHYVCLRILTKERFLPSSFFTEALNRLVCERVCMHVHANTFSCFGLVWGFFGGCFVVVIYFSTVAFIFLLWFNLCLFASQVHKRVLN